MIDMFLLDIFKLFCSVHASQVSSHISSAFLLDFSSLACSVDGLCLNPWPIYKNTILLTRF